MKPLLVAFVVFVALLAGGLWYTLHGPQRPNDTPVLPETYCSEVLRGGQPSVQPGVDCNVLSDGAGA